MRSWLPGTRHGREAGLTWAAEARVETLLVDGDDALDPTLPQVRPTTEGVSITVDVTADAVCLVRLVRP